MSEREKLKRAIARALCISMDIDPDAETMMTMADPNGGTRELGECAEWETMMEQATAALAALEAVGVRMVPSEATHKMADVGTEARWQSAMRDANNVREIWRAMIAASPYAKENGNG